MKNKNWLDVLGVLIVAAAVWGAWGAFFAPLPVTGADCDTDGIWTRGSRTGSTAYSVGGGSFTPFNMGTFATPVGTEAALRTAVANVADNDTIQFTADITLMGSALDIPYSNRTFTIDGAGYTLRQGGTFRVISHDTSGGVTNLTIKNLTITGGEVASGAAVTGGGGIFWCNPSSSSSLTVDNCTITGNKSGGGTYGGGGGIFFSAFNHGKGTLTVKNSNIRDNDARTAAGGGLFVGGGTIVIENSAIAHNIAYNGGGIEIYSGDAIIKNSTLSGNMVVYGGGGISLSTTSKLTMSNSTVYGNSSTNGFGGIGVGGTSASATISFSTITNNMGNVSSTAGGIYVASGNTLTTTASIIVGNFGSKDIINEGSWTSFSSVHGTSGGTGAFSLTNDFPNAITASVFGDNYLANNGGPTWTVALQTASNNPAIGRVPYSYAITYPHDQRGSLFPRPGAGKTNADSGAFETQGSTPPPPPPAPAKLSVAVLSLGQNRSADITSLNGPGTWFIVDYPDPDIISLHSSSDGKKVTVTAKPGKTGSVVVGFSSSGASSTGMGTSSGMGTFGAPDATVQVLVSAIDMSKDAQDELNKLNDTLGGGGVGIGVGGTKSGDLGAGRAVDTIASLDASVDPNAPKMLCYAPSDKPSGIITVSLAGLSTDVKWLLPMSYVFDYTEAEIRSLSAKVGRTIDTNALFTSPTAMAEEFFQIFVLQKEIKEGARTGELARLLGGAPTQVRVISTAQAIADGILKMKVETTNRILTVEFDYCVSDGDDAPRYDATNKLLIVGDGLQNRQIVDPMWMSVRSSTGGARGSVDGGSGCTTGATAMSVGALLLLIPLVFRRR